LLVVLRSQSFPQIILRATSLLQWNKIRHWLVSIDRNIFRKLGQGVALLHLLSLCIQDHISENIFTTHFITWHIGGIRTVIPISSHLSLEHWRILSIESLSVSGKRILNLWREDIAKCSLLPSFSLHLLLHHIIIGWIIWNSTDTNIILHRWR
jgi:hypothetical protein